MELFNIIRDSGGLFISTRSRESCMQMSKQTVGTVEDITDNS